MKFVNASVVMSSLLFASFAQGQSSLKDRAYSVITTRCLSCHTNTFATNKVINDEKVKNKAERMIARIEAKNGVTPMPPDQSSQSEAFTDLEKSELLSYLKTLVSTPEPELELEPSVSAPSTDAIVPLSKLKVEDGFKIEVFAQARGARSLAVHPSGIVFIGTGGFSNVDPEGRVHAIVPTTTGNVVVTLAKDLKNPNGVALQGNDLYVAESSRITVYKNAVASAKALALNNEAEVPAALVVKRDLRVQDEHHWKYIAISPDNKLYVGIGADCNVCSEDRDVGASIFRMDLNGKNYEQVAKGVRNTVGLTFHPVTGQLWFTDNGRDNLGNNLPGDELNVLKSPVQDYGFPFCFASNVTDKDFGAGTDCNSSEFTKPIRDLGAHVAALGLTHYTGSTFPAKYKNATFIAEHGSWDSDFKVGYRLTIVEETVTAGKASYSYRPFVSGFATQQANWGRPSDVKNYIDGSLLLSDDKSGVVYKISPK